MQEARLAPHPRRWLMKEPTLFYHVPTKILLAQESLWSHYGSCVDGPDEWEDAQTISFVKWDYAAPVATPRGWWVRLHLQGETVETRLQATASCYIIKLEYECGRENITWQREEEVRWGFLIYKKLGNWFIDGNSIHFLVQCVCYVPSKESGELLPA